MCVAAPGRAIQGATSHSLGQNFSKMFKITFEGEGGIYHGTVVGLPLVAPGTPLDVGGEARVMAPFMAAEEGIVGGERAAL